MANRIKPEPAKSPRAGRQSQTVPQQGDTNERSPRMPHERDESADSQAGPGEPSQRRVAEAARQDIERGVVDTDRGPVLEETYEKVRAEPDDPGKKFSP